MQKQEKYCIFRYSYTLLKIVDLNKTLCSELYIETLNNKRMNYIIVTIVTKILNLET